MPLMISIVGILVRFYRVGFFALVESPHELCYGVFWLWSLVQSPLTRDSEMTESIEPTEIIRKKH